MNHAIAYTTSDLAKLLQTTPGAIFQERCRTGGYYLGMHPRKLPNGRLLWPRDQVEAIISPVSLRDEPLAVRLLGEVATQCGVSITPAFVEFAHCLVGCGRCDAGGIEDALAPLTVAILKRLHRAITSLPPDVCGIDFGQIRHHVNNVTQVTDAITLDYAQLLEKAMAIVREK